MNLNLLHESYIKKDSGILKEFLKDNKDVPPSVIINCNNYFLNFLI
jgi:hypothetical protein